MPINKIEFLRASTQEWVSASERDPTDEDGLRLLGVGPSGVLEIFYDDIPGNSWNAARLSKFVDRANEYLTKRIPLASLPVDDPDKTNDPNNFPWLYWDGGDLCSRTLTVSNATYDNQAQRLDFTISRVN